MVNDIQISKNFKLREFECREGQEVKLDPELLQKLQALRDKVGKPIVITSGYRTPTYNKKIGGAPKSQHVEGKAADIWINGLSPKQVAKLAEEVGFRGIGTYSTFTHVDTRKTPARWNG